MRLTTVVIGCTLLGAVTVPVLAGDAVRVVATPDGGIQPQAVVAADGGLHLLYFKGEPGGGDLFHVQLKPDQDGSSAPVRVNSQPGSAVALGTVRGGQLALGRGGIVHVAWNGTMKAEPENPNGGSPMLYARSNREGTAFEPQRNLMRRTSGLDGGGTVAADGAGNVYVAWHGRTSDSAPNETGRRMWLARSTDDGTTFAAEEPAFDRPTGACGCCGSRALADAQGTLYVLYRAATNLVNRDMMLLSSRDHGTRFEGRSLQPWRVNACPMSTESLAVAGSTVLAAWETQGEVAFCRIDAKTGQPSSPISPPGGKGTRKHPSVASNARGDTLLAWTEGTGWQKGGSVAWQVFDRSGRPTAEKGRIEGGVPVWGLVAVVARPDGAFVLFH